MRWCGSPEHRIHRRSFLGGTLAGLVSTVNLGGIGLSAAEPTIAPLRQRGKQVIFIWLAGGSSQFETWDPKPGRDTGGPFRTIGTSIPGYHVCELMPNIASRMKHIAVVRSLNTVQSEHEQAADLVSIGRPKEAALDYPEIGVVMSKELAVPDSELPDYVSFFTTSEGRRRPRVGFLGANHSPLLLEKSIRPEDLDPPPGMSEIRHHSREDLRALLSDRFARQQAGSEIVRGYNSAYQKIRGLMRSDHLFNLEKEPLTVRERYGRSPFGQQCLLARRLIEARVPVVKIARGFWDSHHDNFESHRELVPDFDHVFSVLIDDLAARGLLESTLVMVLSEFGRTPVINQDVGRDHFAAAWSVAMAGAGIRGGTIYGQTDADGRAVKDGEANASDLAATIYQAVGIDPRSEYQAGLRPVPLAKEDARVIKEILR
ncbi:DUF1501 domain-containing protein [Zavarzinella formosa]|uniref:DUF1501 domain-containing protein n=1 Tax=Zavarzinella formosa TaxID=360055 RepID=UPI00030E8822|nr:DUF1501 domain-containing protein [Zavarzinella formosa]